MADTGTDTVYWLGAVFAHNTVVTVEIVNVGVALILANAVSDHSGFAVFDAGDKNDVVDD
jgi:hypothetical protein